MIREAVGRIETRSERKRVLGLGLCVKPFGKSNTEFAEKSSEVAETFSSASKTVICVTGDGGRASNSRRVAVHCGMAHVATRDHVDHVLGNIGCVVGDTL